MSAHDPYEHHRAAFATELRRVAPKVRRRRRRIALSGATITLATAVTAVVIIAPTTGSRLDVIADARAAISETPDSIVHYALSSESNWPQRTIDKRRSEGCESDPAEVWRATTTGPPRYRVRLPLNPCGVNTLGARIATGSLDIAYADRTTRTYSPGDGFMTVLTGLPAQADEEMPLSPFVGTLLTDGDGGDPVAQIRSLLTEGKLTDAGEVRGPGGRPLRRLVGRYTEERGDPKAPEERPVTVDYRVDAETFAPVVISTTRRTSVPKDPDAPIRKAVYVQRRITDTVRFSIYETIPLSPATEAQLTVTPPPGTEITTERWSKTPTRPERPSKAERARARAITDSQIKAGIRIRAKW